MREKIIIKRKDYKREKRLFFKGQKERDVLREEALAKKRNEEEITHQNNIWEGQQREASQRKDDTFSAEQHTVQETIHPDNRNVHDIEEKPPVNNEVIHEKHREELVESNKHPSSWLKWIPALFLGIMLGTLAGIMIFSYFNGQKAELPHVNKLTPVEAAIQKAKDNVVSVTNLQRVDDGTLIDPEKANKDPEEVGIGSGVIYKVKDGKAYIVTNYHVVGKAEAIEVTLTNGKTKKAKLVGSDIWTDLAVLSMDSAGIKKPIHFSDSNDLTPGETVVAIGSPLGKTFAGSVSQGIVSGLNRTVPVDIDGDEEYDWEMNVIQTDAAINPGNSGGALINDNGDLIGLNSLKISMDGVEGIGFSIPSNEVKNIIKILEEKGSIKRPKLGILLEDIEHSDIARTLNLPQNIEKGVVITGVEPGSVAAEAGLQQNDVITKIDETKIISLIQFRKVLFNDKTIGDKIKIHYIRDGKPENIETVLK